MKNLAGYLVLSMFSSALWAYQVKPWLDHMRNEDSAKRAGTGTASPVDLLNNERGGAV